MIVLDFLFYSTVSIGLNLGYNLLGNRANCVIKGTVQRRLA